MEHNDRARDSEKHLISALGKLKRRVNRPLTAPEDSVKAVVTSMRGRSLTKALIIIPLALLIISSLAYAFLPHGGSFEKAIPGASQVSSWSLGGGVGTGFIRSSPASSPNGSPSIEFGATFNSTFSDVSTTLSFPQAQNLTSQEYLSFSVYAGPDLVSTTSNFTALFNRRFQFSVTLSDQSGESKTYGAYPVRWTGWASFALPLHYSGMLSGQDPTQIVYNGVSESSRWLDDESLTSIAKLRFDLVANASQVENKPYSIDLNGMMTSHHEFNAYEAVNSVVSASAIFSMIFLVPSYLLVYEAPKPSSRVIRRLRGLLYGFNLLDRHLKVFVAAVIAKIIVSLLAPLSSDFLDLVQTSLPVQVNQNPLTNSPLFGGYMALLENLMYHVWLVLPVDHLELIQIFPGNFFFPFLGRGVFHFPLTPGSILLVLLLKTPSIVADVIVAAVIYKSVLAISESQRASAAASLFWLLNPFNTIIIEMWSNYEMLFILMLMLSVYLLIRNKPTWSAALFGLSVGVRLWAVVLLPFILSCLGRDTLGKIGASKRRVQVLVYVLVASGFALLSVAPFALSNLFVGNFSPRIALPDNPDISFFLGLNLPLLDYTILVLVSLMVVFLFALQDWWKPLGIELPSVLLIFFLIFFALTRWLPHWFLWIMPFLAIDFGLNRRRTAYQALFVATILPLIIVLDGFYFSSWGNSVFFFPVLTPQMASWSQLLYFLAFKPVVLSLRITSVLESALVGICASYILRLYRDLRGGGRLMRPVPFGQECTLVR